MPYIKITTNQTIHYPEEESIKSQLGRAISILPNKNEEWLMVSMLPEQALWFQGSDEPAAIAEVAIYGRLEDEACDELTARITDILCAYLPLDPARVYVKYEECEYWGWNGRNF